MTEGLVITFNTDLLDQIKHEFSPDKTHWKRQ